MRPLLFATFVALMPVAAFGKTWTVGGSGADFPLVAPAIAAAADGDTILVRRGVYRENLTIDRRIALIGEGDAVLYGTGVGSIVKVQADGCEIRGLRIEGSGAGETGRMDAAIEIVSNRNRISGNRMRRVFYGVVVSQGSDNEVDGNEIEGFLDQPFGRRGDGVYGSQASAMASTCSTHPTDGSSTTSWSVRGTGCTSCSRMRRPFAATHSERRRSAPTS
jgi:parallel beta-helix repeat protein